MTMIQTHRYPSKTQPGIDYKTQGHNGEAVCDCPGYRSHGHCWHTDEMKEKTMTEEQRAIALREDSDTPPQALDLTIPARTLPTTHELTVMGKIAQTLVNARGHSVPTSIDSPSKAAAVLLAGWELGVKPMTAFRHIFVVNGRTEPDSQVMMGLVKAKDPSAQFIFHTYTTERCEVELMRSGKSLGTFDYTIEDARKSGQLAKKGPWHEYPRDMLAWAAVKRACRLGAPDLINAIPSIDVGTAGDMLLDAGEMPPPGIEEPHEAQTEMLREDDAPTVVQTEDLGQEQMPLEAGSR